MNTALFLKSTSLFLAAAAVALTGTLARPAHAKTVVSAAGCDVSASQGAANVLTQAGISNISNGVWSQNIDVICPIPDTAAAPKNTLTGFYVDAFDGNSFLDNGNQVGTIRAIVCVMPYGGGGLSCTTDQMVTTGSFTGNADTLIGSTEVVNLLHNANPYSYATLTVRLPPNGVLGYSSLLGFAALP